MLVLMSVSAYMVMRSPTGLSIYASSRFTGEDPTMLKQLIVESSITLSMAQQKNTSWQRINVTEMIVLL